MPDNNGNHRNLAARSPYMRKGGAHNPSALSQRPKVVNDDALDEYREYLNDLKLKEEPSGSSFFGGGGEGTYLSSFFIKRTIFICCFSLRT